MGKQINYWLGYADFLQIAQAALDCGCVRLVPELKNDILSINYGTTDPNLIDVMEDYK